jgi:NAD(P)H-quinone oxidoreductase subunit 5
MMPHLALDSLVLAALLAPGLLLSILAGFAAVGKPLGERAVGRLTAATMLVAMTATVGALVVYTAGHEPHIISFGRWFTWGDGSIAFDFLIDGRSLVFAAVTVLICGVVAAFSNRYLHREAGYNRYFVFFAAFVLGMLLVILAASMEVLFAGWELLGLSSALLVGFFHERRAPVVNAMHVFTVYRVSDAAMLGAAVLLHHWIGSGSLAFLFSQATASTVMLSTLQATVIALLLGVAVAGKSALLPFSGWLPRAMEGPTPSSAVYYGALSIHAGCFLLLRAGPLLEQAPLARVAIALAGAATALYAVFVARVQTDVKSALSYAALTQVGLIVVEIALGLYTLAFIHMLGHASYRLLQFLSAPNVLHDLHEIENAVGLRPAAGRDAHLHDRPFAHGRTLYLLALERGFLDSLLDRLVITPGLAVVKSLDRMDRLLCGKLSSALSSRRDTGRIHVDD